MVVAGPGDGQTEPCRQFAEPRLAAVGVLPVVHLKAEQAGVDEGAEMLLGEDVVPAPGAGMGEHRHAARGAHQRHRLQRTGRVVRLEVAAARMQDVRERGAAVRHDAQRDEGIRDVRSPDGGARGGLREHVGPGDRVVHPDPPHDGLRPVQPRFPDARRLVENPGIERVEEICQKVHASAVQLRAQFHARDDGEPGAGRGGDGLLPTRAWSRGR